MAVVLICSSRSLERDLEGTVLFRADIRRETVRTAGDAQTRLNSGGISLVCLHRQVSGLEGLVRAIRKSPTLKKISIVILSEDDFDPSEVELLEAGANAILRLPVESDFNERLGRLMDVP